MASPLLCCRVSNFRPAEFQGPVAIHRSLRVSFRPSRESLLAAVLILFNSLSFFLIQYDHMRTEGPTLEALVDTTLRGAKVAPEQYRLAMPLLGRLLEVHAHLRVNQSFPLIEFLSYSLTLALLFFLFRSSPAVQKAAPQNRVVLLGFFFTAAQLPMLWIFPWDRPETLPTALYLAAIVLLALHRPAVHQVQMQFVSTCLLATALSIGQALMRADVTIVVGVAMLLAGALRITLPRPARQIAILGLLCASIGAAIQLYLQQVRYPHAVYPAGTPRIQLFANLNLIYPPNHLPVFLTALLPFLVTLMLLRRYHMILDAYDKLVLLICLVYLPVWVTMGLMNEVRIFVPFLFLAAPTIAKLWSSFLLAETSSAEQRLFTQMP
jgi:hypothetical protein